MNPTLRRTVLFAIACVLLFAGHGPGAEPARRTPLVVYDFNLGGTPQENVDQVRSLGFRGIVTRVKKPADLLRLRSYARHVGDLEHFRLFAFVSYDFADLASANVWRQALPVLARARAPLWVIVRNAPYSGSSSQLLGQMAQEAEQFGVRAVIYPHWNTSVETADEAAQLIEAVGHPNLFNSLHTCHEIRGGNQDDLAAVVARRARGSALVAIAGADLDAYAGPPLPGVTWADAIRPLDRGDFDLLPFLQALRDADYRGPVLLQTFGITNDPGHLERSIDRYAQYTAHLTE